MLRFLMHALVLAVVAFALNAAPAGQVTPLGNEWVSVSTTTRGQTRDEALDAARKEAVLSTAGRVLLDGKLIRADALLARYLDNYAQNFVKGVEVLDDQFTGGFTVLQSRVFIDYAALVSDMKEKRFLYTPSYRPRFAVMIDERLDDQVIDQKPAIKILSAALLSQGFKKMEGEEILDPPSDVDVSSDPLLKTSGLIAAERRAVEIVFTGTSKTKLREERDIYYDHYYFYDCEMEVKMIRVDTGTVLNTATARGSASGRDRAEAISLAIQRASAAVSKDQYRKFAEVWPMLVQFASDYDVLLTGANNELIGIVSQYIGRISPDTQVYVKKQFDGSALLTVSTKAAREDFIEFLRMCSYPNLNIVQEEGEKKFEVQVAG